MRRPRPFALELPDCAAAARTIIVSGCAIALIVAERFVPAF